MLDAASAFIERTTAERSFAPFIFLLRASEPRLMMRPAQLMRPAQSLLPRQQSETVPALTWHCPGQLSYRRRSSGGPKSSGQHPPPQVPPPPDRVRIRDPILLPEVPDKKARPPMPATPPIDRS